MPWFDSSFIDRGISNALNPNGALMQQMQANTPNAALGGLTPQMNAELESGYKKGRELFRDDPEMQAMVKRRRDLIAGKLPEIQGQRAGYLRQLQSQAARTGAGGIRQAALRNAADIAGNKAVTQAAAGGADALDKLLMNQRFGELSTGLGYAQIGAGERGANAAASANRRGSSGLLGGFVDALFG
jgi:hypothetical protein